MFTVLLNRTVDSEVLKKKIEDFLLFRVNKHEEEREKFGQWLASCVKLVRPEQWEYFRKTCQNLVDQCCHSHRDNLLSRQSSENAPIVQSGTTSSQGSGTGLQSSQAGPSGLQSGSTGSMGFQSPTHEFQQHTNVPDQSSQQNYPQYGTYSGYTAFAQGTSQGPSPVPTAHQNQMTSPRMACSSPAMGNTSTPNLSLTSLTNMLSDPNYNPGM